MKSISHLTQFSVAMAAMLWLTGCETYQNESWRYEHISPKATSMMQKFEFGHTPEGDSIQQYTLINRNGLQAKVITYGAILTELHIPDRTGTLADVVLGFETAEGYLKGHPYFGTTTGRYANRIAKAEFKLNGRTYRLAANNGPNTLHGGVKAIDKRIWVASDATSAAGPAVQLKYSSPAGEEGFPGNLKIKVTYTLTHANELRIDYEATTDADTVVNLTNHSYFNLAGAGQGTILDHVLRLNAGAFTPVDDTSIPTGEIKPVKGTPMDFNSATALGARWNQLRGTPGGYDHNFVINQLRPGELTQCAEVSEPTSGRVMQIFTTEPGVQLYTGNYLDGSVVGKSQKAYAKNFGFCLETQHYPDSPNKPQFPSTVLKPGQVFRSTTIHRFSAR